jgi:hypothetical protein
VLRDQSPESAWLTPEALDSFKGWLANYYMRIALPDQLVIRLRTPGTGIRDIVKAALAQELEGHTADELTRAFWIAWSPDEDLPPNRFYEISLVVVCDTDEVKELLDRELAPLMGTPSRPFSIEGVIVSSLVIDLADNITLRDLDGKSKFGEWDDLSTMVERLQNMRTAV